MNSPVEMHPFEPFLPEGAKILVLGSFPPQHKRWCMDFYYPNWINDFWRICGLVFHSDKSWFEVRGEKRFDKDAIVRFCEQTGIAMYDTASAVRRLRDNASDKFLEVAVPTDLQSLLERIPQCEAIVTTGEKATTTICESYGCSAPPVGGRTALDIAGRHYAFYRMPSSSRAYPCPLSKKAEAYLTMFRERGLV